MLDQAGKLIVDVVFSVVVYALLLRFLMQVLRAPFRNPVGQALMALTDWLVKPLRRLLPGVGGIDWATLLPAYALQVVWLLALYALFGRGFALGGAGVLYVLAMGAVELAKASIWILIVVVVAQAVLSWVAPDGPLAGMLNAMSFPLLRPLRRVVPPIGGALDLTPLILIVLLQLVLIVPVGWLERALPALLR